MPGVTKGPQLKKMHDDQCKIMGSNAHHALEARIWGIVAGGGALGVVAWFALQFQGELPEFLGTYGELFGPRPWRGHTMADDYGIQLEAAITRKLWYPSMLEIEETACSYGSYVGIPSIKESGGHMMAADMKKVNEDQVLDFGDDDDKPEEGGGTMSFEEYANQESKAAAGLGPPDDVPAHDGSSSRHQDPAGVRNRKPGPSLRRSTSAGGEGHLRVCQEDPGQGHRGEGGGVSDCGHP